MEGLGAEADGVFVAVGNVAVGSITPVVIDVALDDDVCAVVVFVALLAFVLLLVTLEVLEAQPAVKITATHAHAMTKPTMALEFIISSPYLPIYKYSPIADEDRNCIRVPGLR
jgi:hypothetical protein